MAGSAGEAVLDLVVNGKSFFTDLDTAEKRSKNLGAAFSQVGRQIDDFARSMAGVGLGVEKMSGQVTSFVASLGPMATTVLGVGAAAVAGFALVGKALFELSARAAQVGAALDDMAEKTGIAVPELSGLKFVADVTGSSLDQISNAIFKFQQQIGENSKKVGEGLTRIGLSLSEISQLSPDQQFVKIATAISGISDPAQRAAAAIELFGKQGRDLLPLLSKDFEDLIEKSEQLGFTWSATDAAAAEAFEEKSNELRLTLSNIATVIGKELIPAFNTVLDVSNFTVAHILLKHGAFADGLKELQHFNDLLKISIGLFNQLGGFGGKLPTIPGAPPSSFQSIKESADGMLDQAIRAGQLATHMRQLRDAVVPLDAAQRQLARTMLASGDSTKVVAEMLGVAEVAVKRFEEAEKKGATATTKAGEAALRAAQQFDKLAKVIELGQIDKALARQAEMMQRAAMLATVYAIDIQKAIDASDSDQMWELAKSFTGLGEEIQITSTDITDDFIPGMAKLATNAQQATKEVASLGEAFKKIAAGNFKAGFKELGAAIAAMIDPVAILNTALGNLLSKLISFTTDLVVKGLVKLGNLVLDLFDKIFDAFSDMGSAMTDIARQAAGLADNIAAQKEGFADLDATIKKYKFSIEELGPALERQNLDKLSQEIYHDWMLLVSAGISVAAVAREMGESINDFVQRAIASGFEIPEAMRPIIQEMIRLGQLTDAAGQKITDLDSSGIRFSMTMTEGFRALIAAVDRLTTAIARALGLTGALANAARSIVFPTMPTYPVNPGGGQDGDPDTKLALGGMLRVVRPTRFLAGEAGPETIFATGGHDRFASSIAEAIARQMPTPGTGYAGATGPLTVNVQIDRQTIAKAVIDDFHAGGNNQTKFKQLVQRTAGH